MVKEPRDDLLQIVSEMLSDVIRSENLEKIMTIIKTFTFLRAFENKKGIILNIENIKGCHGNVVRSRYLKLS